MSNIFTKLKHSFKEGGYVVVICILSLLGTFALTWLGTCGIIKLITMCFGLTFKWSIATGIWAIGLLIKSLFPSKTTN